MVHTVLGPVSADGLGLTLMHEHVIFDFNESKRAAAIELSAHLLKEAAAAGVESLVELTPFREVRWLEEVAARAPEVNIILCTGNYLERMMPEHLRTLDEDGMYARMVRELTEGIDGSGVKAGIIKVAANKPEMTDWEKRVFRAAARAHKDTGARIATHACSGARAQMDYLVEHGVDPSRVFFSHVEAEFGWEGRSLRQQTQYLLEIARAGGRLLFNNFGFEWDTPWQDLVFLLRYLIEQGRRDCILTSVDANWRWNGQGQVEWEAERSHPEAARRTFAYMLTEVVPQLRVSGFTEEDVRAFLVDNPRQFFGS